MKLVSQLNSIRESIYDWMAAEIIWTPGESCLGEMLNEAFWRRIDFLKGLLSREGYAEQCRDVAERWQWAVAELNSDSLNGMLNSSYRQKRVSPDDACWDCWPENGAVSVNRFLDGLGVLLQVVAVPTQRRYSESREPAEWTSMIHSKGKVTPAAKTKEWQRLREKYPDHFQQDPVRKRRVSMSDWMARHLKIKLHEFNDPLKVD
jgi:hypothetical protein